MNGRQNQSLFSLLPPASSGSSSTSTNQLDVLLDAIEVDPADPTATTSSLPSFASFFPDDASALSHNLDRDAANQSSQSGNLNLDSLLAAAAASQSHRTGDPSSSSSASTVTSLPYPQNNDPAQLSHASHQALSSFETNSILSTLFSDEHSRQLLGVGTSSAPPPSLVSVPFQTSSAVHLVSSPPANSSGRNKRPWDGVAEEIKRSRIKTAIESNAIGVPGSIAPAVTTVMCFHASVAQKSYGTEKRYLCPPPMVRIEGPMRFLATKPRLKMAIISETGERGNEEKSKISEPFMKAFFKTLFVSNSAKAKEFSLQLSLHPPPALDPTLANIKEINVENKTVPDGEFDTIPFASFDSAPVTIISKPSKKTAKARNTVSCIFAGTTISLFNRINSQTVRTKYMAIEDGQLCARMSQWTAFRIHVLRRAEDPMTGATATLVNPKIPNADQTVTYGSEVILTDVTTGVSSEPLVIRRVEKNKVSLDATGPVSQLQKLAFCRVVGGGKTIYLSTEVEGMDRDGNTFVQKEGASFRPVGKRRKKDEVEEDEDAKPVKPVLTYNEPAGVGEGSMPGTICHVVDDHSAWTVIGINSFQYSFFDAYNPSSSSLPASHITPFPTVAAPPEYDPLTHSLAFSVAHFFTVTPGTTSFVPLEVWLGPKGPLKVHVTKSDGTVVDPETAANDQMQALLSHDGSRDPDLSTTQISIALPPISEMVAAAASGRRLPLAATPASLAVPPPPVSPPPRSLAPEPAPEPTFEDLIVGSPEPSTSDPFHLDRSLAAYTTGLISTPSSSSDALPTPTPITFSTDPNPTPRPFATGSAYQPSTAPSRNGKASMSTPAPALSVSEAVQAVTSALSIPPSTRSEDVAVLGGVNQTTTSHSLPLIFMRPSDGIGYLSGRWIVAEGDLSAGVVEGEKGWGVRIV
ncbi:hypothetical protein MNV49_003140 [Pseudohyphozyma bogoriensis]|nr:hypothetical protein MNV49_003140 [Pseudohyphozyma bogoriensis]